MAEHTALNRRRGGGRSISSELKRPLFAYAVRTVETREAICMVAVHDFSELVSVVDGTTPPILCEYAQLSGFALSWDLHGAKFPPSFDDNGTPLNTDGLADTKIHPPTVEEVSGTRTPYSELAWFPFNGSLIYAARSGERIKLGFTTNLAQRLKDLNAQSAQPITLIKSCPGDLLAESLLQNIYAEYFVHGEWLELGQSLETDFLDAMERPNG